jgi:hypothetical protein
VMTYIVNDTADGSTCLCVASLVLHVGLRLESRVSDTVIVVEATKGQLLEIVELHHYFDYCCV